MPKQPHFHVWSGWMGEGCRQSDSGFQQGARRSILLTWISVKHTSDMVLPLLKPTIPHWLQELLSCTPEAFNDLGSAKPPSVLLSPRPFPASSTEPLQPSRSSFLEDLALAATVNQNALPRLVPIGNLCSASDSTELSPPCKTSQAVPLLLLHLIRKDWHDN